MLRNGPTHATFSGKAARRLPAGVRRGYQNLHRSCPRLLQVVGSLFAHLSIGPPAPGIDGSPTNVEAILHLGGRWPIVEAVRAAPRARPESRFPKRFCRSQGRKSMGLVDEKCAGPMQAFVHANSSLISGRTWTSTLTSAGGAHSLPRRRCHPRR